MSRIRPTDNTISGEQLANWIEKGLTTEKVNEGNSFLLPIKFKQYTDNEVLGSTVPIDEMIADALGLAIIGKIGSVDNAFIEYYKELDKIPRQRPGQIWISEQLLAAARVLGISYGVAVNIQETNHAEKKTAQSIATELRSGIYGF